MYLFVIYSVHNGPFLIELPIASVSKRVYLQNHSYENVIHLHVHFHVNQSYFHLDGFA